MQIGHQKELNMLSTNQKKGIAVVGGLGLVAWLLLSGKRKPNYTLQSYDDWNIGQWFTYDEVIRSSEALSNGIDNTPIESELMAATKLAQWILDPIRNFLGGAVIVNSWFRSAELNAFLVSSPYYTAVVNSRHMTGGAADVKFFLNDERRNDLIVFAALATGVPFDRLLIEHGTLERPNWIQLEFDPDKTPEQQNGEILVIPAGNTGYFLSREQANEIYVAPNAEMITETYQ